MMNVTPTYRTRFSGKPFSWILGWNHLELDGTNHPPGLGISGYIFQQKQENEKLEMNSKFKYRKYTTLPLPILDPSDSILGKIDGCRLKDI